MAARTADLQNMVAGLESFNRSISHDLRGPLGGIEGLARLSAEALERGDAAVARRLLPAIASQAQTSGQLVSALLQRARVGDATLRCCEVVDMAPGGRTPRRPRLGGICTRAGRRLLLHAAAPRLKKEKARAP